VIWVDFPASKGGLSCAVRKNPEIIFVIANDEKARRKSYI